MICLANDWFSFEKAAMGDFVSNLNVSFVLFNRPDIKHFGFNKSVATGCGCMRDTVLTVMEGTVILGSALTTIKITFEIRSFLRRYLLHSVISNIEQCVLDAFSFYLTIGTLPNS